MKKVFIGMMILMSTSSFAASYKGTILTVNKNSGYLTVQPTVHRNPAYNGHIFLWVTSSEAEVMLDSLKPGDFIEAKGAPKDEVDAYIYSISK